MNAHREFKKFGSKVLLFGEYAIINGSSGLAIPLDKFSMHFTFLEEDGVFPKSNEFLRSYLEYLEQNNNAIYYNLAAFKADIDQGLKVSSSIPIGYGLGSSGALVANFFYSYCHAKEHFSSIQLLKKELGFLESFFHGASSGLDPLVSYLNKPIHIVDSQKIEAVDIDMERNSLLELFLLNSGVERRTAPLVQAHKQKLDNNASYYKEINDTLVHLNTRVIDAYLAGNKEEFNSCFRLISEFQLLQMKEMIPNALQDIFITDEYALKICGAGGGGFYLGTGQMNKITRFETFSL